MEKDFWFNKYEKLSSSHDTLLEACKEAYRILNNLNKTTQGEFKEVRFDLNEAINQATK